jgi:alpha-L-fucosidase
VALAAGQRAEWYWWYMNLGKNNTKGGFYEYNLETYGPDHVYDDFIQNFTASEFDPKEWVDLFADAGANYFVQVSKHHDGKSFTEVHQAAIPCGDLTTHLPSLMPLANHRD